ncbi:hypothetical protein ACOMHN_042252 [Nucella lapillus]
MRRLLLPQIILALILFALDRSLSTVGHIGAERDVEEEAEVGIFISLTSGQLAGRQELLVIRNSRLVAGPWPEMAGGDNAYDHDRTLSGNTRSDATRQTDDTTNQQFRDHEQLKETTDLLLRPRSTLPTTNELSFQSTVTDMVTVTKKRGNHEPENSQDTSRTSHRDAEDFPNVFPSKFLKPSSLRASQESPKAKVSKTSPQQILQQTLKTLPYRIPDISPYQGPQASPHQIPEAARNKIYEAARHKVPEASLHKIPEAVSPQFHEASSRQVPEPSPRKVPEASPRKVPKASPRKVTNASPRKVTNASTCQDSEPSFRQIPETSSGQLPKPWSRQIPRRLRREISKVPYYLLRPRHKRKISKLVRRLMFKAADISPRTKRKISRIVRRKTLNVGDLSPRIKRDKHLRILTHGGHVDKMLDLDDGEDMELDDVEDDNDDERVMETQRPVVKEIINYPTRVEMVPWTKYNKMTYVPISNPWQAMSMPMPMPPKKHHHKHHKHHHHNVLIDTYVPAGKSAQPPPAPNAPPGSASAPP